MRFTPISLRLSDLFHELSELPEPADELRRLSREGMRIIASAIFLLDSAVDSTPRSMQRAAADYEIDVLRYARNLGEQDRAVRIVREMLALASGKLAPPPISATVSRSNAASSDYDLDDDFDDDLAGDIGPAVPLPSTALAAGYDSRGNPIQPGDRIIHDMLGRPLRVHPANICAACGELRGDPIVCRVCGTVCWREPIATTVTTAVFVGGAFAALAYLGSWGPVVFWVGVILGGICALGALAAWAQALRGGGIELSQIVGTALICGGIGWLIDWGAGTSNWATVGACGGALLGILGDRSPN